MIVREEDWVLQSLTESSSHEYVASYWNGLAKFYFDYVAFEDDWVHLYAGGSVVHSMNTAVLPMNIHDALKEIDD